MAITSTLLILRNDLVVDVYFDFDVGQAGLDPSEQNLSRIWGVKTKPRVSLAGRVDVGRALAADDLRSGMLYHPG